VTALIDALPAAAAVFAVPQFVPQLVRIARSGDTGGVSWSWASLTSVNNAAWGTYFEASHHTSALVPSISASVLAALLALMLTRRGARPTRRTVALVGLWVLTLIVVGLAFGVYGLSVALIAAFVVQVTPCIWRVYRSDCPSGVSVPTWVLVFGELLCWAIFGIARADPRLIVLGLTGIVASATVIGRTLHRRTRRVRQASRAHSKRVSVPPLASSAPELPFRIGRAIPAWGDRRPRSWPVWRGLRPPRP